MQIHTTRFGALVVGLNDVLEFRNGLIGLEDCRHWILLADPNSRVVGWLQSADRPDIAVAVVSPRRFVPDYRARLYRDQLGPLELGEADHLYTLCVVSKEEARITMNLRAPVLINLDRRLGCQVITVDDQPLQADLAPAMPLRRSA